MGKLTRRVKLVGVALVMGAGIGLVGCGDACERECSAYADMRESCGEECQILDDSGDVVFQCPGSATAHGFCSRDEWVDQCRSEWHAVRDENPSSEDGLLQQCSERAEVYSDGDCCTALGCCVGDDDDYVGDPVEVCCGCLESASCLENVPGDVSSAANWCRGQIDSVGTVDYDDGCLASSCASECAGVL